MGGCDGCVIHQCVSEVPERDSGCCSSSRPFQLHEPAALGRSDPAEEGGGTGEKQAERNISSLETPQLPYLDRTKGGSASKKLLLPEAQVRRAEAAEAQNIPA